MSTTQHLMRMLWAMIATVSLAAAAPPESERAEPVRDSNAQPRPLHSRPEDSPVPAAGPRDLAFFLRRLRTRDHLPRLEGGHTALSSTWNREGHFSDPDDFKRIEGTRNILLDAEGPGCIHRIFVGRVNEEVAGTRIQIFIDRSPTPVFDLPVQKFFDDRDGPFPYPLVFHKTYPGVLFPIPYEKHCLVQLVNPQARNWGTYWQVAYTTYEATTEVRSLRRPFSAAERNEIDEVCRAWLEAESGPPAQPAWTHTPSFSLAPGESSEVRLSGAGVIRELRILAEPPMPDVLRGLRLRITWDRAAAPSVDVPVGYLFGHADHHPPREARYSSLLMGVQDGEGYARFPMPFSNGAILALENQAAVQAERVRVRLAVETPVRVPDDFGRFHVTWTEKRAVEPDAPRYGKQQMPVHIVLDRHTGPGKYVGTLLHVVWPHAREWWGEGDWLFWSDEDAWPPRYHGTGTEEYFNSGWGEFDRKAVSGYVTTRPGHETVYSFHLNDSFSWRDRFRAAVETVGFRRGDVIVRSEHPIWGTTAYWYAHPPQPAGSRRDLISPR